MPKTFHKSHKCLNCHLEIGEANYCPNCGQINSTRQLSLRQFVRDAIGEFLTFDSKFFRSFIPLVKSPGFLTKEYIAGRRTDYILPLRLYLFTTIIFFFMLSLMNAIRSDVVSAEEKFADAQDIQQIFDRYGDQFSDTTEALLITDLQRRFTILKTKSNNTAIRLDTLWNALARFAPDVPPAQRMRASQAIHTHFNMWIFDGKRTAAHDSVLVDSVLAVYFPDRHATLSAMLDTTMRFIKRKQPRKQQLRFNGTGMNININNTDVDSLKNPIAYRFGQKVKSLALRGEEGGEIFLTELINQLPKVLFLLLPVFALILKALYVRQKIFYINHLIFSLHAHTIIFLYLLIYVFIDWPWLIPALSLGIWIHLFLSMKNVYNQHWFKTAIKLNLALLLYLFPLVFGFALLSFLAVMSA